MSISINDLGEQELDQHHVLSFLMECSPDTGDMLCLFIKEQHDTNNDAGTSTSVPSWDVFQKMIFLFGGMVSQEKQLVSLAGMISLPQRTTFLCLKVSISRPFLPLSDTGHAIRARLMQLHLHLSLI